MLRRVVEVKEKTGPKIYRVLWVLILDCGHRVTQHLFHRVGEEFDCRSCDAERYVKEQEAEIFRSDPRML